MDKIVSINYNPTHKYAWYDIETKGSVYIDSNMFNIRNVIKQIEPYKFEYLMLDEILEIMYSVVVDKLLWGWYLKINEYPKFYKYLPFKNQIYVIKNKEDLVQLTIKINQDIYLRREYNRMDLL